MDSTQDLRIFSGNWKKIVKHWTSFSKLQSHFRTKISPPPKEQTHTVFTLKANQAAPLRLFRTDPFSVSHFTTKRLGSVQFYC